MNGEKIQNQNTSNTENPFEQMAKEVGEFDLGRQKVNSMNGYWKKSLNQIVESPIDEATLAETQIDKSLDNPEWQKQIIKPYVYGILASASEIGKCVEQCRDNKDGLGLDYGIKGAIKLFSEIYGLKQEVKTNVLDNNEYPGTVGLYYSNDVDLSAQPSYEFWIGFGEIEKTRIQKGENRSASELISTIAHEMWHAKQDEIVRTDDTSLIRRKKYIENYQNYKDTNKSAFEDYHDQMLEDEAHTIEYAVMDAIKIYQHDKEAFDKNATDCIKNKAEMLQLIRKQEQKLAEKGI